MEMKKINSGKLRAIGYDSRTRLLQVQLDDGSTLQYGGVARILGAASAARRRRGASIATTSRRSSPRSASPATLPLARTRSTSCSVNPEFAELRNSASPVSFTCRTKTSRHDAICRACALVPARWAGPMAVHIFRFGHVESPLHHVGQWRIYPGLSGIGQVKVK